MSKPYLEMGDWVNSDIYGREGKMITKNYIKMCEQAKEIQKGHKWKKYDRGIFKGYRSPAGFIKKNQHFVFGVEEFEEIESWWVCKWLPTLEQLFEMVEKDYGVGWNVVLCFRDWVDNQIAYADPRKCKINILEYNVKELLLLFVMYELYNKTWTGKTWEVAE